MGRRPRHYDHVIRILGLFAGGFTVFVIVRYLLVPVDFGVYGFYRAGALTDARAKTPMYAATTACFDCHGDVEKAREGSKHQQLSCQACHGPLAKHAAGDTDVKPAALDPKVLCVRCHTAQAGLPKGFPGVVVKDHAGDSLCTDCHQPHHPKIG
jgi:hypothetical protein